MTATRGLLFLSLAATTACGGNEPSAGSATTATTSTTTADTHATSATTDDSSSADTDPSAPGACETPIAAVELDTAKLSVDPAGHVVDALGRDVVMRGLNTGGRSKFAPFLPFVVRNPDDLDEVRAEADIYFERMVGWGLDTARMPMSWEALEPQPGVYDRMYLARYEVLLDSAWAHGIRVIVDFHQDVYASPFCGDGFPPWSVPTADPPEPSHECRNWFLAYFTNADMRESFDRFWADTDGLQDPFLAMWLTVADAVGSHPAVVGFEPMNEPGWGTTDDIDAFKTDVLTPWYSDIAVQLQAATPEALIFYDGPGIDSSGGNATHFRPEGEGLVYAPHLYDATLLLGTSWGGIDPGPALSAMAGFGTEVHTPVLLGEFGFTTGAKGGNDWLTLVMDAVDRHRMSATLWEYSTSAELWNGEDLSVTDADGSEREILDGYVRPWLRAAAGEVSEVHWDRDAGEFTASFVAAEGVTEVVVPARLFPEGPATIELTGEGGCYTWDEARAELRVTAPAGTSVSVRLQ